MQFRVSALVYPWFSALCLVACLGLPGRVLAQEVPFTGVVIQNQTDVRAGAADRYYRVGELNKGQLVQVDEVIAGWNKIVPPEGFYSYISKAFVDAKGDGSTGVVNSDRSKVYAADVNGPAGSYRVQAILNSGDGVQIVAEEGSHYKIVAPTNAYVYLPPGSVRRALAMETAPAEPAEAEPADTEPVEEPKPEVKPEAKPEPKPEPVAVAPVVVEPTPEPVVEAPAEPAPTVIELNPPAPAEAEPVADSSSEQALNDMLGGETKTEAPAPVTIAEGASLDELEKSFKATKELPVEEKPLAEMIAGYEALQAGGELSPANAVLVKNRLIVLRHEQNIAEGLAVIAKANEPQPEPAPDDSDKPVTYDAVGRLLASSVYDGKTLPRMFRLTDPATGRAVAYIRADGPVASIGHLGKLVGVVGKSAYDPDLKLKVITVKRIDTLEAAAN
ncbi:MAG: hypothetical protein R3C45_02855 [Phycisphaerales bacterium]